MKKVLLIDSGSGGINILKECVRFVPCCDYLMFCDNKHLPYGNKTKKDLQKITLQNLREIYKYFKFDIVVLACNTLTCTCLDVCRKKFADVIFIGTVPAIKPALLEFKPEDILVLATEVTIKHNILINKTKGLMLKSMPCLARDIDENLDELKTLRNKLYKELEYYKPKAVVLGCTHYSSVGFILEDIFGKDIRLFDSANGVARRLRSFVPEDETNYQVQIMASKDETIKAKLWWYYNNL